VGPHAVHTGAGRASWAWFSSTDTTSTSRRDVTRCSPVRCCACARPEAEDMGRLAMLEVARAALESLGLPPGDDMELRSSEQRFPDGGHYKIEAATVNTLAAATALLDALGREGIRLDQLTHTFGL